MVLHAELRGSAVALKSLRTGMSSKALMDTYDVTDMKSNGTSSKRFLSRRVMFPFIDSAYSLVADERKRGALRLQRAFLQAGRQVNESEAARRKDAPE